MKLDPGVVDMFDADIHHSRLSADGGRAVAEYAPGTIVVPVGFVYIIDEHVAGPCGMRNWNFGHGRISWSR